jgi:hypothetical protein
MLKIILGRMRRRRKEIKERKKQEKKTRSGLRQDGKKKRMRQ